MAQRTRRDRTHQEPQETEPQETETQETGIGLTPQDEGTETDPTNATGAPAGSGDSEQTAPDNTVTTAHVRTWAQARSEYAALPNHGRIPEDVKAAYLKEFPAHTIVPVPGKKKGTAKPLIPIPLDEINFESVPENEWESHPLSPEPAKREAYQVAFDNRVKAVYDEWVKVGAPAIRKAPRDRIAIDPQYGPAVRKALKSAGTLHKVEVTFQPLTHDPQGRQVIVFTATEKQDAKKPANPDAVVESTAHDDGSETADAA